MNLSDEQVQAIARRGEDGQFVTLEVIKALPEAGETELAREINRVYDAMDYPEAVA